MSTQFGRRIVENCFENALGMVGWFGPPKSSFGYHKYTAILPSNVHASHTKILEGDLGLHVCCVFFKPILAIMLACITHVCCVLLAHPCNIVTKKTPD
jgi:hypothetical protein